MKRYYERDKIFFNGDIFCVVVIEMAMNVFENDKNSKAIQALFCQATFLFLLNWHYANDFGGNHTTYATRKRIR